MPTVCIAGKSEIACEALNLVLQEQYDCDLLVLPSQGNLEKYKWQPSLEIHAKDKQVPIVQSIEDLYSIPDLVFLSLEYDKLINPNKFNSNLLYNLHFSYLPEYRGVYTSILPLRHGKTYSGVTIHRIDSGIDSGPILDQTKFALSEDLNARDLYFKYQIEGFKLLKRNLRRIIRSENIHLSEQKGEISFFSRQDLDLKILQHTFDDSARNIHNFYRSLIFPEFQLPLAFGKKVTKSRVINSLSTKRPGTILSENMSEIIVSTRDLDINLTLDISR